MLKKMRFFLCLLFLLLLPPLMSSAEKPSPCEDCWSPKLNFDIEGGGFKQSMVFISSYSYSLTTTNKLLRTVGKSNYFCGTADEVGSKELIEILNSSLSGEVTAENVSFAIAVGLMNKYPCDSRDKNKDSK